MTKWSDACPGLVVESFGGVCPVQAWGTLLGFPFYFRARHEHWSFGVAESEQDVTLRGVPPLLFERVEAWGDRPFAAGYMPDDEATALILRCAREFVEARGRG